MIASVKVLGAGSIGNHMTHAARTLGWHVDLCDISQAALERTRSQIYPGRYGAWDNAIGLFLADQMPRRSYDLIVIGTPPDSHMDLAIAALADKPKALLIEKPLCGPNLVRAQELFEMAQDSGTRVFVGYDHVVGEAAEKAAAVAASGSLGPVETLDVEFREHWGGIFAAHPWLDGPGDSYLGHWQRGGGASGEHSHATNLWQSFAQALGAGRVVKVTAVLDYVLDVNVSYDKLCLLTLETQSGLIGRVVQDVVTSPPRKWARIQGRKASVEWHCGFEPGQDAVIEGSGAGESARHLIKKSRPDDFVRELRHIAAAVENSAASPISLARGLDTMVVIAAAHKSAREHCTVTINYDAGYTLDALASVRLQEKD